MKRFLFILLLGLSVCYGYAQQDKLVYKGYFSNKEYDIFLRLNLYDQDVSVPQHEMYGKLAGYLGKKNNSFVWLITDCNIDPKEQKATITLINDYGSEDLTATLTLLNDTTLSLKQEDGSPLKVPKNGKWLKLPKQLSFKR